MPSRYVHRHVVTLDETNMVGNVYFAHFAHWQGHCRELFLAEHTPGVLRELTDGRLTMVTVSCRMDYFIECFALDEIEVAMSLSGTGGNRLSMDFEFLRGGVLVARGSQTVACLRRAAGAVEPVELPDELTAALAVYAG